MIYKIVILFFVIIVLFLIYGQFKKNYSKGFKKFIAKNGKYFIIILLAVLAMYLILTGKIQFIWVLLLAAIPWLRRVFLLWRGVGMFKHFQKNYWQNYKSSQYSKKSRAKNSMSPTTAAKILGVNLSDDIETIQKAYIKKMNKVHPDKGGDKKEAQKLNQAREVLQNFKKT